MGKIANVSGLQSFDDIEDPYVLANRLFHPSRPIREVDRLFGREAQVQSTQRALGSPGRSVFIFGDRGVGKTSLAQTVAYLSDTTGQDPAIVSCYGATFSKVITQVAQHLMRLPFYARTKRTLVRELKLGGPAGHILHRVETKPDELVTVEPMYAVDVLNEIAPRDQIPVVVVDELDLASADLKRDFAHFIKQLGDKDCPVKFIFTGIAEDADQLLAAHESAARYVASVPLDRLLIGDLTRILDAGFGYLKIRVPDLLKTRVALLSDGFGSFTHLLGLKLAMCALDAERSEVDEELLENAISDAVGESEVWLKNAYEQAVRKYHDRYESILWALADHYLLLRSSKDIYQSYLGVCRQRYVLAGRTFELPTDEEDEVEVEDVPSETDPSEDEVFEEETNTALTVLSKKKFSQALYRLKQNTHGEALDSQRKGWHRFRLPMMRGYCRMIAARHGVHIGLRYLDSHNKLQSIEPPHRRRPTVLTD